MEQPRFPWRSEISKHLHNRLFTRRSRHSELDYFIYYFSRHYCTVKGNYTLTGPIDSTVRVRTDTFFFFTNS